LFPFGWWDWLALLRFRTIEPFHPVEGDVCQQRRDDPALWCSRLGVGVVAEFDHSRFQPAVDDGGKDRNAVQQGYVVNIVEAAFYVCVEYPRTRPSLIEGGVNRGDCVHCAAARAEAIRVGFKAGFPFGFERCLDDGLHHAVFHGWYPQRTLFAVALWDVDPPNGLGAVAVESQAVTQQLHACFGCVAYHAVNACGAFAPAFLCDAADCQELVRRGTHQKFLKMLDLLPLLTLGGAVNPLLQSPYIPFHCGPVDAGPRWFGLRFGQFSERVHRLTSPKLRALPKVPYRQDQSDVSPLFGVVALPCGSHIPAISAGRSLLPTSRSPYTIPLPYGWDTAEAGCMGFPQLATEKMRVGEVGACPPVGVADVAVRRLSRTIQPTHHFGYGMSASFTV
jgi:hypothetical protein